jgi:hypothetical protein
MEPRIESIYLVEILAQCRNGRRAERSMQQALAGMGRHDPAVGERIAELFDDAADFLAHAGNVSKILWPPRPEEHPASARGRSLRESLGLTSGHALESRTLRNHLEHYDERLDGWAAATSGNIADGLVGPQNAIAGNGIRPSDIMRQYDPATHTFVFRGESFEMKRIAAGLGDVVRRAEERLQQIAPELFAGLRSAHLI